MSTALLEDTIEHLDFDFVQPCEHSLHSFCHSDEPAAFLIGRLIECCHKGTYFLCESGWDLMGQALALHCNACGIVWGPRDKVLKIIRVLDT